VQSTAAAEIKHRHRKTTPFTVSWADQECRRRSGSCFVSENIDVEQSWPRTKQGVSTLYSIKH
jgi:hypothetical protein